MEYQMVTLNIDDLNTQLNYLIRREFFQIYLKYRQLIIVLLITSVVIAAFIFISPSDSLITIKAMGLTLLMISWFGVIIYSGILFFRYLNRLSWKNKQIEKTKKSPTFEFCFDKEKLYFKTDSFKSELNWKYYEYYVEYKDSIFFIPSDSLYGATFYSISELKNENYERLKIIASDKLKPL